MDEYSFFTDAQRHLTDFRDQFANVITVLSPDEQQQLYNRFDDVLRAYFSDASLHSIPADAITDQLATMINQLMAAVIQHRALARALHIADHTSWHPAQSRLFKSSLSQQALSTSATFKELQRKTDQLHKLGNDTYHVGLALKEILGRQVKNNH